MNDIFEEYRSNNSAENRIFGVVNRARFSVREAKKKLDNMAFILAGAALALSGTVNASSFKDSSKVDLRKPVAQFYFESASVIRVSDFSKSNIHSGSNVIIDSSGYKANTRIADSGFDEVSSTYGLSIRVSDANFSNFSKDGIEDAPIFNAYLAPSWLSDFLNADRDGNKRLALNHLMDAIDLYEENSDWSEFCQVLNSIDVSSLSNTALVGVLRNTFVFRDEIPAWKPFSRKVSDVISARGANVDKIMSGLLA